MKRCAKALMMCLSMFCAIPCPYRKWDEDARPLTTLFLPLVGVLIGGLWTLAAYLLQLQDMSDIHNSDSTTAYRRCLKFLRDLLAFPDLSQVLC